MTKKKPGAKRGAKPQDDEKNLDLLADTIASGKFSRFEIETEKGGGGAITYNLTGASRAVAKKSGRDARHDGADRKRLSRKMARELKNALLAPVEDGEVVEIVPRLENAYFRRSRANGPYPPGFLTKTVPDKSKS